MCICLKSTIATFRHMLPKTSPPPQSRSSTPSKPDSASRSQHPNIRTSFRRVFGPRPNAPITDGVSVDPTLDLASIGPNKFVEAWTIEEREEGAILLIPKVLYDPNGCDPEDSGWAAQTKSELEQDMRGSLQTLTGTLQTMTGFGRDRRETSIRHLLQPGNTARQVVVKKRLAQPGAVSEWTLDPSVVISTSKVAAPKNPENTEYGTEGMVPHPDEIFL